MAEVGLCMGWPEWRGAGELQGESGKLCGACAGGWGFATQIVRHQGAGEYAKWSGGAVVGGKRRVEEGRSQGHLGARQPPVPGAPQSPRGYTELLLL